MCFSLHSFFGNKYKQENCLSEVGLVLDPCALCIVPQAVCFQFIVFNQLIENNFNCFQEFHILVLWVREPVISTNASRWTSNNFLIFVPNHLFPKHRLLFTQLLQIIKDPMIAMLMKPSGLSKASGLYGIFQQRFNRR